MYHFLPQLHSWAHLAGNLLNWSCAPFSQEEPFRDGEDGLHNAWHGAEELLMGEGMADDYDDELMRDYVT